MDENIKEEVYKCSKCGLCQSVCPIYLATKNEMFLPRGRYIILNNFFNNGKKLTKKFIKNLDICLNCNLCKDFCPSCIDAEDIYTKLKYEYGYKYGVFSFSFLYFIKLYFYHILSFFKKDGIYKLNVKRKKIDFEKTKEKVVYFQGCINKYINPSDKNATLNILEKLGYDVIKVNSDCCGLPFLSDGNLNSFEKNSKKIINTIPNDVKYLVCSCDSCFNTLSKIPSLVDKLICIDELLKINNVEVNIEENVVYHKTLMRKDVCYSSNKIKLLNKKGLSSLMENYFMLKYPKMVKKNIDKVFYSKNDIDSKLVVTTCQLSNFGMKYGVKNLNSDAKIVSYSEYVDGSNAL